MKKSALFALLAASWGAACGTHLDRTNPYDAGASPAVQAKGTLTGTITLEAESDHSGILVGLKDTSLQTQTNADGTFRLTGVPVGSYDLVAGRPSYQTSTIASVTLTLGRLTVSLPAVELLLKRTPVSGRVVLQGESLSSGAIVTLRRTGRVAPAPPQPGGVRLAPRQGPTAAVVLTTLTESDGGFTFPEVPAGTFSLTVAKDRFSPAARQGVSVPGEGSLVVDPITLLPLTGDLLINNGATYTDRPTVQLAFSVQNVAKLLLSENADFSGAAWTPYGGSTSYVLTPGDGLKTLYVKFQDPDGNETDPKSASILLDTAPPYHSALLLNEGAPFARQSGTVEADLAALDLTSGVDAMELWETGTPSSQAFLPSVAFPVQGDGPHVLQARFRDRAGNWGPVVTAGIVVDTQPPVAGTALLDGGAASTGTPNVTLTLTGSGADQILVSNRSDFAGASWVGSASAVAWTLSPGDGAKTVYVKARDLAGNEASYPPASITLDTLAPTVAAFSLAPKPYTSSPTVTLAMSVSDAGSIEMRLSERSDFSTGTGWVPYAPTAPLVFTGADGVKAAFAQFRDAAGNASAVLTDTTVLDTHAPSSPAVSIDGGAAYTISPVVQVAPSAGGADEMHLWGSVVDAGWIPYAPEVAETLVGGTGAKSVAVEFRDAAGNRSATAWAAVTYTAPPTVYGRVLLSGAPVSDGVSVSLVGAGTSALALSGSDGAYAFTNLATEGIVQLTFSRTDYDGASQTVPVAFGSDTLVPETTLEPRVGGASGTALLGGASDSSGITVTLTGISNLGRPVTATITTSSTGSYGFSNVLVGSGYTVTARSPGYVAGSESGIAVLAGQDTPLGTLTLPEDLSGSVTGYAFLQGATGGGHFGIAVALSGTTLHGSSFVASTLTDASGRYTLSGVPGGNFVLTLTKSDYDLDSASAALLAGQAVQAPDAVLPPSRGTVLGSARLEGSSDASGITVTLAGTSDIGRPVTVSTTTDGSGGFLLSDVLVGTYQLRAAAPNYVTAIQNSQTVLAGGSLTVAFGTLAVNRGWAGGTALLDLGGCASVTSHAGISVGLSGVDFRGVLYTDASSTDGSGHYVFSNVPPGAYGIVASKANFQSAATDHVAVPSGGTVSAGTIRLVDAVAPTTPRILTSSTVTASTAFSVSIVASSDASSPSNLSGYQKLGGGYATWANASPGENVALNFSFTLNADQNNTLQVRAIDCSGNVGPADFLNVVHDDQPPAAPTNLTAESRDRRVDLDWTGSSSPDTAGYLVYYGPISSQAPTDYNGTFADQGPSPIDVGKATQLTLTGLQNLTGFNVAVQAYDRVPLANAFNQSPRLDVTPSEYPLNPVGVFTPSSVGLTSDFTSVALVTDYVVATMGGSSAGYHHGFVILDIADPRSPKLARYVDSGTASVYGLAVSYPLAMMTFFNESTNDTEIRVYDLRTPTAPALLGSARACNCTSNYNYEKYPLAVQWPFLYFPAFGPPGMIVFNLLNPASPQAVTTFAPGGDVNIQEIHVVGKYAYVMGSGLYVVDVSNPGAPKLVGGPAAPGNGADLAFAWPYLFSNGLAFNAFDIRTPTAPVWISSTAKYYSGFGRSYAVGPLVLTTGNGMIVWDASDPTLPRVVDSRWKLESSARVVGRGTLVVVASRTGGVKLYTLAPRPPIPVQHGAYNLTERGHDVKPWFRSALVLDSSAILRVLDPSSNPDAPVQLQQWGPQGTQRRLYADRTTAYAFLSISPGFPPTRAAIETIEISNPADPSPPWTTLALDSGCAEVGGCDCSAYGIDVQGGIAYVANGLSGVRVVDVTAPLSPRLLATVDTPDCALWVRAYGPRLYVADRSDLLAFDVSNPAAPALVTSAAPGNVGLVTPASGRLYVSGQNDTYTGNGSWVINSPMSLRIFDAATLQLRGSVTLQDPGGVEVTWPYAYVGTALGFYIVDVTNDAAPLVVGRLDTQPTWFPALNGAFAYGTVSYRFGVAQFK